MRHGWFRSALAALAAHLRTDAPHVRSVAFPEGIGCGLAGGDPAAYRRMVKDFADEVSQDGVHCVTISRSACGNPQDGGDPLPSPDEAFTPSKQRVLQDTCAQAYAGVRAAGKSVPALLVPDDYEGVEDHVEAAKQVDLDTLARLAVPPLDQRCLRAAATAPNVVEITRARFVKLCAKVREDCRRQDEALRALCPPGSPQRKMNIGSLHRLCRLSRHGDSGLPGFLVRGVQLGGVIHKSGVLPSKPVPATITPEEFLASRPQRNKLLLSRLRRKPASDVQQIWDITTEEVDKGTLAPPTPVPKSEELSVTFSPRFCVVQGPKVRIIDDLRISKVNQMATMYETNRPDSLNVAFASMRYLYKEMDCKGGIEISSCDVKSAFRAVGVRPCALGCDHVGVLRPGSSTLYRARMLGLPFGSTASPVAFARLTAAVKHIARALGLICLQCYVDDFYIIEPADTIDSAVEALRALAECIGILFDPKKDQAPSSKVTLLGADITIEEGTVTACVSEAKRVKYLETLLDIAKSDTLSPGIAAKMAGRLNFSTSLLFGRWGRSMTRPFTVRQYTLKGSHRLNPELRHAVRWWIRVLSKNLRPKRISLTQRAPVVAYSDAEGTGSIGVVIIGRQPSVAPPYPTWKLQAPAWCDNIQMQELGGVVAAAIAIHALGMKGPVYFAVDNQSVIETLIKGSSGNSIMRHMAGATWALLDDLDLGAYFEYVPSRCNIADAPSREEWTGLDTATYARAPEDIERRFAEFHQAVAADIKMYGDDSTPPQGCDASESESVAGCSDSGAPLPGERSPAPPGFAGGAEAGAPRGPPQKKNRKRNRKRG